MRKTPVDGEIIGKIGQGNQVRLLKQKEGWCQIVTPTGNEGWMICDALGL
ncbi:MAG: SH3 domain-containing protein [Proteobacteria bacterium]|nr:SH3 domain-containing protein [Pseudomonadota bacterium]